MRSGRVAFACALAGCARGGAGPGGSAAAPAPAPIGNRVDPPPALPKVCERRPHEGNRPPWERLTNTSCMGAARAVDGGWVELSLDVVLRYDRTGRLRWRAELGDCGMPEGIAIDARDQTVVACGYSVLAFAPDGARRWQVWPARDRGVTPPLVDADGTVYVGSAGGLYALAPADGATRWQADTGWNRWFSAIAPTPAGELVFWSVQNELHSDEGETGGYRFYYDYEAPEMFVVDRAGHIVSREVFEHGEAGPPWPRWVDVVGEGGGRLP
jgi:outer membrane protein assembly factor BamB